MASVTRNIDEFLQNIHLFANTPVTDAEIVVTRYNESLEWTKDIAHLCSVYNKGPTPLPSYLFNKTIDTPNFGFDIETILRHIILNYDTLALMTFFCQGTILDRADQPLYPLDWYLLNGKGTDFKALEDDLTDSPKFRIREKVDNNEVCHAVSNRPFDKFCKEVIGISYRCAVDKWVKGDWFSVGRDRIRAKPREYYMSVYVRCQFHRGIVVEEIWYLERVYHSMFTRPINAYFKFIPPENRQKELLEYLTAKK
jgi:hypothetical protein